MKTVFLKYAAMMMLIIAATSAASGQEYVAPTRPAQTGRSPGVKVKLLSTNGQTKTYVLIFSKNDEIVSGLTEFAQKYKVQSAHYTGIGDAFSAKVGFFDYGRNEFKVIPIGESEISSLMGDIAVFNGKSVAHTHINLATSDGTIRGGHLLECFVGPTLELFVTVEPTPIYKRLSPEFNAGIIDPALEN
jgi:predicted DNA-binding protein with PD1-like motif